MPAGCSGCVALSLPLWRQKSAEMDALVEDLAADLGVSVDAAKSLLARARRAFLEVKDEWGKTHG